MRLRLVDLTTISLAIMSLIPAVQAGEPGQVRLRGSNVYTTDDAGPSYPIIATEPSHPSAAPPPSYPGARTRAQPVAVAAPASQLQGFTLELGTRYWISSGTLAKDLLDDPRSSANLNSRLTYSGLGSGTFEGYGRIDTTFGSFFKGYGGLGGLNRGALNDEDFPPGLSPYSSTLSQQLSGKLAYGSIDFGQILVTRERTRWSLLAGYGYLNEKVNAVGCAQIAGNPFICAPALDPGLLAITENASWQFARVGLLAEFKVLDCLKLSAEVAWLPYVQVVSQDTHWLRLGSQPGDIAGPIPERGGGSGVQLEAIMSYQVSERVTLGLGARYWHLQTRGNTDFESVIVGVSSPAEQPLNFSTTRMGGFAQGAYKFGPL
jgi:hypothetical protein